MNTTTTTPPLLQKQRPPPNLRTTRTTKQQLSRPQSILATTTTTTTTKPEKPHFLLQDRPHLFNLKPAGARGGAGESSNSVNKQCSTTSTSRTILNATGKRPTLDLTQSTTTTSSLAIEPPLPPPPKRSKSTLDNALTDAEKKSRALERKKEKAQQHEKMTAESITWRHKYKKAFPTFVFYFDSLDSTKEMALAKAVERLGAVSLSSSFLEGLELRRFYDRVN